MREPLLVLPEPEELPVGRPITADEAEWRNRRLYWHLKESQAVSNRARIERHPATRMAVDRILDPSSRTPPRLSGRLRPPLRLIDLPRWAPRRKLTKLDAEAFRILHEEKRLYQLPVLELNFDGSTPTEEVELVSDWWGGDRGNWVESLWLESTLRCARGRGWGSRQHMLWGLTWPLPVGREALRWWAESRRVAGYAGEPYSADGTRIERLSDVQEKVFIDGPRPLTEDELRDVDIKIDALPLPLRDLEGDVWLGLAISRRVEGGVLWLFGTIEHAHGLNDHVYTRPRRDLRFGTALPGWPTTQELPRATWARLRNWYRDTFEGQPLEWGGRRPLEPKQVERDIVADYVGIRKPDLSLRVAAQLSGHDEATIQKLLDEKSIRSLAELAREARGKSELEG
jgi:hypothetical protein